MARMLISLLFIQVVCLNIAHAQSWRNIWTTITPPTTARPTRQSIFDSLRAVQEAMKRRTANDPRFGHFEHFPVPEPVKPKPTVAMHHPALASPNNNQTLPNRYNDEKTWNLGSSIHSGSRNHGAVLDNARSIDKPIESKFDAISNIKSQPADNSLNNPAEVNPTNFGHLEEAGMLGILPTIAPNADVTGMDGVVALYAMDHAQDATSSTRQTSTGNFLPTAQGNAVRSSTTRQTSITSVLPTAQGNAGRSSTTGQTATGTDTPTTQGIAGRGSTTRRLKVLPNGSIVDFGIDGSTQTHARPTRLAPTITSDSQPQSTAVANAEPVRVSPLASLGQGHNDIISTSGLSLPIRYPEPTSSTKFPNAQPTHSSSTHGSLTHGISTHGSSTHGSSTHGSSTHGSSTHGSSTHGSSTHGSSTHGISTHGSSKHGSSTPNKSERMPIAENTDSDQSNLHETHHQNSDDLVSSIMKDPRYFPRARAFAGLEALEKPKTAFVFNLFDMPTNFSVMLPTPKTTTTERPTTTTTVTTTTTTTTAPTTTTTMITTTTTPAPTEHPDDVAFYSQGGLGINITYLDDNHVCPPSRARWQDFTVYLETKPRLCMIQVTFNARYKREAIYTNTWWGQSVDYVYTTVYDPEVNFMDAYNPAASRSVQRTVKPF